MQNTSTRTGALLLWLLCVGFTGIPLADPAHTSRPSVAQPTGGKVFLTVEEALELAFGGAEVERTTIYLDQAQERRASKLAGNKVKTRVVHAYRATGKRGQLIGVAYFDTHIVRSKRETLMVVVAPDQSVRRVEVLAFAEPPKYIPRGAFYGQLKGKFLNDELALGRGVRSVSGATLTAQATLKSVRRVLALHRVILEAEIPARRDGAHLAPRAADSPVNDRNQRR